MWRILVVDDNFANRQLLIEILRGMANCDVAANGKEAVEAYNQSVSQARPYDMVLLDIAMPEVDGIEFLKMVRDNERKSGIEAGEGLPIIMVTAFKHPFMEAFNQGCDDYLLKPINVDLLLKKIQTMLDSRKKI